MTRRLSSGARSRNSPALVLMLAACVGPALVPHPVAAQGAVTAARLTANASLSGTVLTETTERPLMNAVIRIDKLGLNARTDSAGNFSITGIDAGEYAVSIRLTGFESLFTTLTFAPSQKLEADFLLKDRVIQFASKAATERSGQSAVIGQDVFDERRKTGVGRYVGADRIVESDELPTAEIIRAKVPALHVNAIAKGQAALASKADRSTDDVLLRGDANDRKSGAKADCYVQVLLNGQPMYRATPDLKLFDVNSVPSRMLMTAEYYPPNDTPAQYRGPGSQCGTLVIWTRGR